MCGVEFSEESESKLRRLKEKRRFKLLLRMYFIFLNGTEEEETRGFMQITERRRKEKRQAEKGEILLSVCFFVLCE